MPRVEQAVFTSAETDRSAGYQVVARSPGVGEDDARELAVWGPSHDSLLDLSPEAVSFNFHPLPSGAYCVARTVPAGWEYSGRGGRRVYTQCLLVPPEVLERFANNPFAVLRAALAGGGLTVHQQVPRRLEPLLLGGRASPVDQTLLARLAVNPGPERTAALVQSALDSACLAVAGGPSAADLIAGLFSCLPTQLRCRFSFATGLKFSSRRPLRIVALSDDRSEQRWVAHHANVTILDLSEDPPPSAALDGWARLIERVLAWGRVSFLATQLSKRRFDLTPDDLPALGLQLIEDLEASTFHGEPPTEDGQAAEPAEPAAALEDSPSPWTHPEEPDLPAGEPGGPDNADDRHDVPGMGRSQRAHAPHPRFVKTGEALAAAAAPPLAAKRPAPASEAIDRQSPGVLEKLEQLDDVVYEAISGQATALEQLETLWPALRDELGPEVLEESREQYLRYALQIWEAGAEPSGARHASRAIQALDVLCILFDGA